MKKDNLPLLLFLISFFVYFFIGFMYGDFYYSEDINYLDGAEEILNGNLFFYPPDRVDLLHRIVHQLVISGFLFFGADLFFIRFYSIIFSVLTVIVFYYILRYKYDSKKSFFGSLLLSSLPLFVGLSPTLLNDNIAIFFSMFGLYLYLKCIAAGASKRLKFLFACAIVLSLGFLIRETVIIVFAVIFFHLLLKDRTKRVLFFSLIFISLPLFYLSIFIISGKPLPWINFFIGNVEIHKSEGLKLNQILLSSLATGGIIGIWGLIGILQKLKYKNLRDNLDMLFFLYFIFRVIAFLLMIPAAIFSSFDLSAWSEPRHLITFLPALTYFAISCKLPKIFSKKILPIMMIIIIINYFMAGLSVYFYLKPHRVETDAVTWVIKNVGKETPIFVTNNLIRYLLKHEGYNISQTLVENAYYEYFVISDGESNILKSDVKEIERFEAPCTFTWFRPMECEKNVILIFGSV